jgi:hypothetical protein
MTRQRSRSLSAARTAASWRSSSCDKRCFIP